MTAGRRHSGTQARPCRAEGGIVLLEEEEALEVRGPHMASGQPECIISINLSSTCFTGPGNSLTGLRTLTVADAVSAAKTLDVFPTTLMAGDHVDLLSFKEYSLALIFFVPKEWPPTGLIFCRPHVIWFYNKHVRCTIIAQLLALHRCYDEMVLLL
jgi:hypothetical protein